jgi:hypothetical protein
MCLSVVFGLTSKTVYFLCCLVKGFFRRVHIVAESAYYLRHVHLYVHLFRIYQRGSHWIDFREILCWRLL